MTVSARLLAGALVAIALAAAAPEAGAQARDYVGPGKCTDCHDHKDEKEWSEKRDGDGRGKQHINALNQLADKRAATYASAIGLADVYDTKGTCVKCHATVVRGSADFGVSCETCHGPGKDYLKPHQEKGAYERSVALGMKDLWKKPQAWVRECTTCHILGENPGDARLIDAGHSSGDDFNLATKFTAVAQHWMSKYSENQIAELVRPIRTGLLARRTPPPAPVPAPPAAPPPAAAVASPSPPAPAPSTPVAAPPPGRAPVATEAPSARPRPASPVPPLPPVAPSQVPAASAAPAAAATLAEAVPPTATGYVAAVQGRLAAIISQLLTRGVSAPIRLPAQPNAVRYRGADAELLRLQEDVLRLAIEALGRAPATPARPQR
jgi:hypothetical protein